jgi:hypothetical protein
MWIPLLVVIPQPTDVVLQTHHRCPGRAGSSCLSPEVEDGFHQREGCEVARREHVDLSRRFGHNTVALE